MKRLNNNGKLHNTKNTMKSDYWFCFVVSIFSIASTSKVFPETPVKKKQMEKFYIVIILRCRLKHSTIHIQFSRVLQRIRVHLFFDFISYNLFKTLLIRRAVVIIVLQRVRRTTY